MHQLTGATFGIGTPFGNAITSSPWGLYQSQGPGLQSFVQPPYLQPLSAQSIGAYGGQPIAAYGTGAPQSLEQLLQLLQIIPQQLQQIHLLHQQQLIHLQQLLQQVPAQLQQLAQIISQQLQQRQQWQPFAQSTSGPLGFGMVPQTFGGQTAGHVM